MDLFVTYYVAVKLLLFLFISSERQRLNYENGFKSKQNHGYFFYCHKHFWKTLESQTCLIILLLFCQTLLQPYFFTSTDNFTIFDTSEHVALTFQPSSSGRSAELLSSVSLDQTLMGGKLMPLFPTFTSPAIEHGLTAEFSVCIKKLNKKDPVTKTKVIYRLQS